MRLLLLSALTLFIIACSTVQAHGPTHPRVTNAHGAHAFIEMSWATPPDGTQFIYVDVSRTHVEHSALNATRIIHIREPKNYWIHYWEREGLTAAGCTFTRVHIKLTRECLNHYTPAGPTDLRQFDTDFINGANYYQFRYNMRVGYHVDGQLRWSHTHTVPEPRAPRPTSAPTPTPVPQMLPSPENVYAYGGRFKSGEPYLLVGWNTPPKGLSDIAIEIYDRSGASRGNAGTIEHTRWLKVRSERAALSQAGCTVDTEMVFITQNCLNDLRSLWNPQYPADFIQSEMEYQVRVVFMAIDPSRYASGMTYSPIQRVTIQGQQQQATPTPTPMIAPTVDPVYAALWRIRGTPTPAPAVASPSYVSAAPTPRPTATPWPTPVPWTAWTAPTPIPPTPALVAPVYITRAELESMLSEHVRQYHSYDHSHGGIGGGYDSYSDARDHSHSAHSHRPDHVH